MMSIQNITMQLPLTMNSFRFIGSFGGHKRDNGSVKLTLMPAIRRASIVCGTPSWSLPQEKMMRKHMNIYWHSKKDIELLLFIEVYYGSGV